MGANFAAGPVDRRSIMESNSQVTAVNTKPPMIPSFTASKTEAKQAAKLAGRKSYSIAIALENGPVFNADYLLNTIMATGAKYIETQKANKKGKFTSPAFCKSEAAQAIICPINAEPSDKLKCYPIYL